MTSLSISIPAGFVALFCKRRLAGAFVCLPEFGHGIAGGVVLALPVCLVARFVISGPLASGPGLQVWPLWAAVIVVTDTVRKGGLR